MYYALLLILVVGLILVIVRVIPPVANLLPYFIINDFFIDIQLVKAALIIVLLPLLGKSKTHLAWQEVNSDVPITKKKFTTAIYLEAILSTLLAFLPLLVTWIVGGLINPDMNDAIFETGIYTIGEAFFWAWLTIALFYTLRLTPIRKTVGDSVLIVVSCLAALQVTINLIWRIDFGHYTLRALILGFIVLAIGWIITAMLYKKIDL